MIVFSTYFSRLSILSTVVAVSTALLLSACSSAKFSISKIDENVDVVPLNISIPALNVSQTGELGDAIIEFEQGHYVTKKYQVVQLVHGMNYEYSVQPGVSKTDVVRLSKDKNGAYGACFDNAEYRHEQITFCVLDANNDGYFEQGMYGNIHIDDFKAMYKITTVEEQNSSDDYIKKQLIYKGISNKKLKFNYLEFHADMNVPTIDQDFTIDNHTDSDFLFGYKGARIKIKKADNVNVEYKIQSYFNNHTSSNSD
jgi:hypothetical protein